MKNAKIYRSLLVALVVLLVFGLGACTNLMLDTKLENTKWKTSLTQRYRVYEDIDTEATYLVPFVNDPTDKENHGKYDFTKAQQLSGTTAAIDKDNVKVLATLNYTTIYLLEFAASTVKITSDVEFAGEENWDKYAKELKKEITDGVADEYAGVSATYTYSNLLGVITVTQEGTTSTVLFEVSNEADKNLWFYSLDADGDKEVLYGYVFKKI